MKKLLTFVLAIVMIASMASLIGCNGDNTAENTDNPAAATPATATPSAAPTATGKTVNSYGEDIQAMLDAGEDVLIGLSFQGLSESSAQRQRDNLTAGFEEKGFTVTVTASEGDMAQMISQIENLVLMDTKLIVCFPPDSDGVKDVTTRAMADGVYVVFAGLNQTDYPSGGSTMDWSLAAQLMAEMAIYWVDQTFPDAGADEIHAAVATFAGVTNFKIWSEKIIELIDASDKCKVTYTKDSCITIDEGFTFAEEALTSDLDIRFFACWMDAIAFGASNYVMSQPDLDYTKYASFGNNPSEDSLALLELSKENKAIYRGGVKYGYTRDAANSSQGTLAVSFALLFGEKDPPYWALDKIWSIDVIGFDKEI